MDRFSDHTIGGKGAFQHCAAGKVDDFHLENRLNFVYSGRYYRAAAFNAMFPQLFQFFHCCFSYVLYAFIAF
jgi:hypothetical protein